jgi:outer membrane protein OmpA-like peptidoglycan-associated protein
MLLAVCITVSQICYAISNHSFYELALTILSYSKWSNLLFDFNKANIKPEHVQEINRLAKQLNKYDLHKLKIVGHTDDIGNPEYNQKLSEERAQSVASIFVQQGFKQNDLTAVGRGSSQPFVPNTSDENSASNRRVAVIIIP